MFFARPDAFPGRPEQLGVTLSLVSPGCLLAEIAGELDLNTAPQLHARLCEALEAGSLTELVIDLTRVEFMAVAGITALLDLRERARRQGVALMLVARHRAVLRPLTLLGLIHEFDVRGTLDGGAGSS